MTDQTTRLLPTALLERTLFEVKRAWSART